MAYFFDFENDYTGLDSVKAEKMLDMYGYNTYTKAPHPLYGSSYADVLLSPSVILMFIAGVLCFFGMGIGAGTVVLLIELVYVFTELYLRKRSDDRLDEIEASTAMKFRVIRSGRLEFVEKEYIVPDDLIVIQAGERVPADAFILESRDLMVDESILTGSNKPVAKYEGAISKNSLKPTFVYSGTAVVAGIAVCRVSATGVDTKLFNYVKDIKDRHPYYTQLESFIRANVPICSAVGVVVALIMLIMRLSGGGSVPCSAISSISVGLCFIPTGISSIIRLYYTNGALSLIKRGVMMKSFSDIEKLNSLSVLCIEKEGAISKNSLEVRGIYAKSEELLYKVAALSFDRTTEDPAERALMLKAAFFDENISDVYRQNKFIEKISDFGVDISGAVWKVGDGELCCVKGAPERILPLCRISGDALYDIKKKYDSYYANGFSVMAVACVDAKECKTNVTASFSYTFVGLAAFSAPLRDSVSSAVKTCRRSGVRVVMLTEDSPNAAASTGNMIGMDVQSVVTGDQIAKAQNSESDVQLDADIYAKISSEQKAYIINKLKESGEVVAMTGTRTGDAEALENADVGITIAQNTTGSALETADIVMNDDNFLNIANMIAYARQIHRNIKRAAAVLFSGYTAILLITVINIFAGSELMLNPPLLAVITMFMLPLLSASFFGCSADMQGVMPPSDFMSYRKINFRYIGKTVLYGACTGAAAAVSYTFMYGMLNEKAARSCAFVSFTVCTVLCVLLRFSDNQPFQSFLKASKIQKEFIIAMPLIPPLLIYLPYVNKSFGLSRVDFPALMISIATGLLPALIIFFTKRFLITGIEEHN